MNPPRIQRDGEPVGFKQAAIEWLFLQGSSTILLVGILVAIGWGGHYAVTVAIPAHIEQIQSGYTEIEKAHLETEAANRQAHREALREVLDHEREMRGLDRKATKSAIEDSK